MSQAKQQKAEFKMRIYPDCDNEQLVVFELNLRFLVLQWVYGGTPMLKDQVIDATELNQI